MSGSWLLCHILRDGRGGPFAAPYMAAGDGPFAILKNGDGRLSQPCFLRKAGSAMKKKKITVIIACAALAVSFLVGGTFAYLTDGDSADNRFTIGEVQIDLMETDFDEGAENGTGGLTPGKRVDKNPAVTNTGKNGAYVFLKVTVPTGITAASGGDKYMESKTERQLFEFTVNSGWTLVDNSLVSGAIPSGKDVSGIPGTEGTAHEGAVPFGIHTAAAGSGDGRITYVYAYTGNTRDACRRLEANGTTQALFNEVVFTRIVENAGLDSRTLDIDVTAYAIQDSFISTGDTAVDGSSAAGNNSPGAVWKVIRNQDPSTQKPGEDASTDMRH